MYLIVKKPKKLLFLQAIEARHKSNSQNSKIYFGYVDSKAKIFLILYTPFEISTTRIVIIHNTHKNIFVKSFRIEMASSSKVKPKKSTRLSAEFLEGNSF